MPGMEILDQEFSYKEKAKKKMEKWIEEHFHNKIHASSGMALGLSQAVGRANSGLAMI